MAEFLKYWLDRALKEAEKSPCLRMHFGAVIVKNGIEIGRGNNKPPYEACETCMREDKKITPRTRAEYCKSLHAEQWAILDALKRKEYLKDAVMFVAGYNPRKGKDTIFYNRFTCTLCSRMIAASGLSGVVSLSSDGLKYKTAREVYDEAFAVQEEIINQENMGEEEFQRFLLEREKRKS